MADLSLQAESVRINPTRFDVAAIPGPFALSRLAPQSLAEAILARYSPHDIANVIEALIDALDALTGDPDLEDDDPAGMWDEDGINISSGTILWLGGAFGGPGCAWSDDDRNVNAAV